MAKNMAMKLKDWRTGQAKTLKDVSEALCVKGGARTIHRIETGAVDADADMAERIRALTGGAVTPIDLHFTRLAWLKENRPGRVPDCASCDASEAS